MEEKAALHRIWPVIAGLFAFSIAPVTGIHSQTTGTVQTQEEKRPTTRDPRYIPPYIPPYLLQQQEQLQDPGAALLLNPGGDVQTGQVNTELERSRVQEQRAADAMEGMPERDYLEKYYLPQFGLDQVELAKSNYPDDDYKETKLERFTVIFLMALPITTGFSYGIFAANRASQGRSFAFTGPETAAFIGLGILGAAGVGWYDTTRTPGELPGSDDDLPPYRDESSYRIRLADPSGSFNASDEFHRPEMYSGYSYTYRY